MHGSPGIKWLTTLLILAWPNWLNWDHIGIRLIGIFLRTRSIKLQYLNCSKCGNLDDSAVPIRRAIHLY